MATRKIVTKTTSVRVSTNSPSKTKDDLDKALFLALERLNGYTEKAALLNWKCVHGKCKCP
jgi:hypothetical protein